MNESILEPVNAYFNEFRDKHKELCEQYFDELVRASGVSSEENALLMAERNKEVAKLNNANRTLQKQKGLRAFLIVLAVLLFVAGIVTCIVLWGDPLRWVGLVVLGVCVAVAVALIVVVCVVLNKRVRLADELVNKHKANVAEVEQRAWKQMQPLNAKYDWNIPDGLIYKTVPQICFDKYFDEDKLNYFHQRCALAAYDEDSSALWVKSGNSNGRPFLFARFLRQSIEAHTYTGFRTVSWTETVHDSNGSHTVTHSETLTATVVKPMPVYSPVTYLFYGCDAATELHFSRKPTVPPNADDKKIESIVKKGEKALEKKAREAVSNGGTYNKLANSEFEVLFGADDRDNELQFRLMFTPLAQQNTVKLLRSLPYGDDFYFTKSGPVNVISSAHSSRLAVDANPMTFVGYDLAKARENFVKFNCEYFSSVYFDFAPLFSVPLYTQDAPAEKFGVCEKPSNIGDWEAEAVANNFDSKLFAHPETATDIILKASTTVGENSTVAHVTAHSFQAIPQVDYVPVWCSNGRTYDVPVPWTLFVPLEQETDVEMQSLPITREQFNAECGDASIFVAGIKAKIL